jgi:hypothetical protein
VGLDNRLQWPRSLLPRDERTRRWHAPPISTTGNREQVRIVPAQDCESLRATGQHGERVGVDAADRLLDADHVVARRQLEQRGGAEPTARTVRDVVDDDGNRRPVGDVTEMRHDRCLRGPHVVGTTASDAVASGTSANAA